MLFNLNADFCFGFSLWILFFWIFFFFFFGFFGPLKKNAQVCRYKVNSLALRQICGHLTKPTVNKCI